MAAFESVAGELAKACVTHVNLGWGEYGAVDVNAYGVSMHQIKAEQVVLSAVVSIMDRADKCYYVNRNFHPNTLPPPLVM